MSALFRDAHATVERAGSRVHGVADPDIGARRQPLDVAAISAWNAAQARARVAYEDVKARAAVPQSARSRRARSPGPGGS